MPEEELFNLTEYAKKVREEALKIEKEYKKERGETDADNRTDKRT